MRDLKKLLAVGLACAFATSPQMAGATVFGQQTIFDYEGGNTPTTGTYGNSITQTVNGITATATAWSMNSATGANLQTAYLGDYAQGLGVTDRDENGSYPYHTVDNVGDYDFIVFTFSQPVQLTFGTLAAFALNPYSAPDNDAWVSFTYNAALAPITTTSVWNNLQLHATEVLGDGSGSVTLLDPGMNTGNQWIIGADDFADSGRNDAFKLSGIAVQLPVAEPATWASMIAGIGMVGAAMRRRRLPAGMFARA